MEEKLQKMLEEISEINIELQAVGQDDVPEIYRQQLSRLGNLLARVDFMYAEAEEILNIQRAKWSEELDSKIQATRFKELLEGKVALEQKVWRMIERTHKTINTLITMMITQLSYLKEELRASKTIDEK
jgi:predicted XRE-type DNA-binding protein